MTTDTAAPTNPQTISNANGTHDIEQGPDSYNTDLIKAAHREGFIYIDDLVVVLARETGFTEKHLPGLWEKFGCERRRGPIKNLSNQSQRFKRWFTVLYRLAFGFADHPGADDSLTGRYGKLIKTHIRGKGGYQPADLDHFKQNGHSGCYLGLEDLRDYLVNYAEIPAEDLPGSLFTPQAAPGTQDTLPLPTKKERKKNPDQLAKLKCREIAQGKWISDPSMTIADMIMTDEIEKACIEIGGKSYTENALRGWVKDLCPNRSPGRRSIN